MNVRRNNVRGDDARGNFWGSKWKYADRRRGGIQLRMNFDTTLALLHSRATPFCHHSPFPHVDVPIYQRARPPRILSSELDFPSFSPCTHKRQAGFLQLRYWYHTKPLALTSTRALTQTTITSELEPQRTNETSVGTYHCSWTASHATPSANVTVFDDFTARSVVPNARKCFVPSCSVPESSAPMGSSIHSAEVLAWWDYTLNLGEYLTHMPSQASSNDGSEDPSRRSQVLPSSSPHT